MLFMLSESAVSRTEFYCPFHFKIEMHDSDHAFKLKYILTYIFNIVFFTN